MADNTPVPTKKPEVEKIKLCDPSLYGGRLTRKLFFRYSLLGGFLFSLMSSLRSMQNSSIDKSEQSLQSFTLLVMLFIFFFFLLPIAVKRAHDIGHKGTFIIITGTLPMITQFMDVFSSPLCFSLALIISIPSLIYSFVLFFKDSQKGTNAYGPSIKYPDTMV